MNLSDLLPILDLLSPDELAIILRHAPDFHLPEGVKFAGTKRRAGKHRRRYGGYEPENIVRELVGCDYEDVIHELIRRPKPKEFQDENQMPGVPVSKFEGDRLAGMHERRTNPPAAPVPPLPSEIHHHRDSRRAAAKVA